MKSSTIFAGLIALCLATPVMAGEVCPPKVSTLTDVRQNITKIADQKGVSVRMRLIEGDRADVLVLLDSQKQSFAWMFNKAGCLIHMGAEIPVGVIADLLFQEASI